VNVRRVIRIFYHSVFCWGLFCLASTIMMFIAPFLWVVFVVGGLRETRQAFQEITYRFHRWYVKMLEQIVTPLRFIFIPPHNPIEIQGPAIIISNHSSVVDLLLMMSVVGKCSIVGKKTMAWIPLFGLALKLMGMIFVDRRRRFEAQDVFYRIKERLAGGEKVLIFPQGSRRLEWNRRNVKRGIFKVAMEMKTPIVPVAISGTGYILKKGQFFFDIGKPLKVLVNIFPPVNPQGNPENAQDVIVLRNSVVDMVDNCLDAQRDLRREGLSQHAGSL